MKEYIAKSRKDPLAIYLSSDAQMDKYLAVDWDIFEKDDGEEKLIATPEEGFLTARPSFPVKETTKG